MSSSALNTLCDRFNNAYIHKPHGGRFIPDSKLFEVLEDEDDNLEQCLKEGQIPVVERDEVLMLIRNGAQKLFAIIVLMRYHPVRLILDFMRKDQMLQTSLDARLPFSLNDLNRILQDKSLAHDFDRGQWEVLSPLFRPDRSHRELEAKTILPFIHEEPILGAKGGFGIVSKVTLHEAHHCFDQLPNYMISRSISQVDLARKEILVQGLDEDAYENERRIMRLLRLLRHDNMLQLLASYSIHGSDGVPKNFLLMPLADMSLTRVLKVPKEEKAPTLKSIFGNDTTLLCELHGVASALDQLHHYQHKDKNIRLKGCHFDLDPRNILIQGGKLLLADFGLSRLKRESADSCTPCHGGGASHYTAPECLRPEQPEYHGSKSDMWSFGAIIYDLVACMMGGAQMVANFQNKRKHTTPARVTSCRFHIEGACNPGVEEWIDAHWQEMSFDHRELCNLAKQILILDPKQRPDSSMIAGKLFLIAAMVQFRGINETLSRLARKTRTLRVQIEQIKLVIWARHAGLLSDWQDLRPVEKRWLQEYSKSHLLVKDLLQKAKTEIEFLLQNDDLARPGLPVFENLQKIREDLWSLAPDDYRRSMEREAEIEIIELPDIALEEGDLPSPNEDFIRQGFSENESRILQLAAMRKFNQSVTDVEDDADNESNIKCLDEASVKVRKSDRKRRGSKNDSREWSLISLKESTAHYLCEWVYYEQELMQVDPQRLHRRVRSVVRQLSAAESHVGLRALPCQGYFVSKSESAFGIVFSLPTLLPTSEGNRVEPMTLNQTILWSSRPSLTEIFRTAKAIAKSIFNFHSVSFVHKNISSYSVVVFDEILRPWAALAESSSASRPSEKVVRDQPQAISAQKPRSKWSWTGKTSNSNTLVGIESDHSLDTASPIESGRHVIRNESLYTLARIPEHYITGFNHSRADDKFTFTSGKSGPWFEYQHFRYASQPSESYQAGYDYYSLGLVLLELGLWTPLNRLSVLEQDIGNYPLDRLRDLLCEKAVSQLIPMMGDKYAEAVRICLSDHLLDLDRTEVEEKFSKEVLARLEDCNV